jgi:hypothetical protein
MKPEHTGNLVAVLALVVLARTLIVSGLMC